MLYEIWSQIAKNRAKDIALWHPDHKEGLSFADLDQKANDLASGRKIYVAHGDDLDFLPTILAAWMSDAPVILVEGKGKLPQVIDGAVPDGIVLIKQTCGASGVERSLFFTADQVLAEARRNIDGLGLHVEQSAVAAISLAHSYGFGCLALPLLLAGIPVCLLPAPLPLFVSEALDVHDKPVFLPSVPAIWKMWWQTKVTQHPNIGLAVSAGAPLSLKLEQDVFNDNGLKIHNFYGTSETGALAFDDSNSVREDESYLGKLLGRVKVEISEKDRIATHCRSIAAGADVLLKEEEFEEEFYETQDCGFLEEDRLFLTKCLGKAINVAGRKVSPDRIASILEAEEGIYQAKVYAERSRDFERYEEIHVRLKVDSELNQKEFKASVRQKLESWETPRKWIFVLS